MSECCICYRIFENKRDYYGGKCIHKVCYICCNAVIKNVDGLPTFICPQCKQTEEFKPDWLDNDSKLIVIPIDPIVEECECKVKKKTAYSFVVLAILIFSTPCACAIYYSLK